MAPRGRKERVADNENDDASAGEAQDRDVAAFDETRRGLKALIPDPLLTAIVRAAHIEEMEAQGNDVLFTPENVADLEAEAQENEAGGITESVRGLLIAARQAAGKTMRELLPDIDEASVRDSATEARSILVTSWIEALWLCARDSGSRCALLGENLLPLQRNDFLVEHRCDDWQDVLVMQLGGTIPREATLWLFRVFAERLRKIVDAACDKDSAIGHIIALTGGKCLIVHRGTRSPYVVRLLD